MSDFYAADNPAKWEGIVGWKGLMSWDTPEETIKWNKRRAVEEVKTKLTQEGRWKVYKDIDGYGLHRFFFSSLVNMSSKPEEEWQNAVGPHDNLGLKEA